MRSNLKAIAMRQMLKRRRMKKLRTKRIITMLNKIILQRKVKPSKFKRKTLKGMRTLKRTTTVMTFESVSHPTPYHELSWHKILCSTHGQCDVIC